MAVAVVAVKIDLLLLGFARGAPLLLVNDATGSEDLLSGDFNIGGLKPRRSLQVTSVSRAATALVTIALDRYLVTPRKY